MIAKSSPYIIVALLIAVGSYWLGLKSLPTADAGSNAPQPTVSESLLNLENRSNRESTNRASISETLLEARELIRYDNGSLGRARLTLMIEDIDPALLDEAFAEACQLAKGSRLQSDPVVWGILMRWSKIDPRAAYHAPFEVVTWGTEDMRRDTQLDLTRMPLIELSKRDPKAAFDAWNEHMPQLDKDYDNSTEFLLNSIFESWADQDFDKALAAIEGLNRDEAEEAIGGIISSNPDRQSEILSKIENAGDEKLLMEVKGDIVTQMVRNGRRKEAIAWVDQQPMSSRPKLEKELAEWWLHEDPRGAGDWYLARGNEGDLDRRIETIVRRWAEWEPNAAGEWLGRTAEEHGALADRAKARFARTIIDKDLESALNWLESIINNESKLEAARTIGNDLQRRGITADPELIGAANLAEEEKSALLGN